VRRYIVTGDRHWDCIDVAVRILSSIRSRHDNTFVVVHGAARGVDSAFAEACRRLGIEDEPHPAKWDDLTHPEAVIKAHPDGRKYNANAGPIRNQEMVDLGAEYAIAVQKDLPNSKGTRDCVERCLKAGIAVYHVDDVHSTRRIREI
jgi:hypothetical protein